MNCVIFADLAEAQQLPRHDRRVKHLLKILKLREGDSFRGAVIDRFLGRFVLAQLTADQAMFRLESVEGYPPGATLPPLDSLGASHGGRSPLLAEVELAIGYCRPLILKRVFRDGAALGVKRFGVFATALGDPSYLKSGYLSEGRYREQLVAGIEQAGDFRLPTLQRYEGLAAVLTPRSPEAVTVVLDRWDNTNHNQSTGPAEDNGTARANPYLWSWLAELRAPRPIRLVVGSERGFTAAERQLIGQRPIGQQRQVVVCRLGPELVRADTAALAGLAALWQRFAQLTGR